MLLERRPQLRQFLGAVLVHTENRQSVASVCGLPRGPLQPPDDPLSDGEIVLRMRRDADVPVIAEASRDPETQRRLDDEPLTPDRQRDSVSRAQEQWRRGSGAPFVIADATDDRPLGLLNLQFGVEEEVAGVAVSVFPQARGRGVASKALRLGATWGLRELRLCRVFAEAAWITPPRSVRSRRLGFSGKASSALTAKPTANDMTASCFRCSRRTSITCKSSDLGCGEIPHRRRAGSTCSGAADRRRPQPSRADDRRGGGLGDELVEWVAP